MKNNETSKKALFVATVDSHIESFHLPYLKLLKECKYEVHVATNTSKPIKYSDKKHKISIKRSPFKLLDNLRAIKELKRIMQCEKFDIVHCHTPVGGFVARMAGKVARKSGTRVIYTAHGFHFFVGSPFYYWLMFYPVEKYLARYTDALITINDEDYRRAKKRFSKRCHNIVYVPGVGVDKDKFKKTLSPEQKVAIRKSLGLEKDDFVLICVGRLDKNKNQGLLIRTIKELLKSDSKYHLILVGIDEANGSYHDMAKKLGVENHVHFLGFRDDVLELFQISDIALSSSRREGLPVNLIEAAFLDVPIIATKCRGNTDVCKSARGVLVGQNDVIGFRDAIVSIRNSKHQVVKQGRDLEKYQLDNIQRTMYSIYNNIGKKNKRTKWKN